MASPRPDGPGAAKQAPHGFLALRAGLAIVCIGQVTLLVGFAARNRFQLNPDGVAYLGLARHYVDGELGLAVSAYWGPLLSWLMAPLLWWGAQPLVAARAVTAASALVLALGAASLMRRVGLATGWVLLGTALVAVSSVGWTFLISPDLLMAGLLAGAIGRMLGERALDRAKLPFGAGLLAAAAYLAKPVALPVAFATAAALFAGRVACGEASRRAGFTAFTWFALGAALLAGPWIGVLSLDRGHPTLSTSGPINHALIGPPPSERSHPVLRTYHRPDPGRVTQWEDPSNMTYHYWSPLESPGHFRHQLSLVGENTVLVARHMLQLDRFGVGIAALLAAFFLHRPWRTDMRRQRWRWLLVPALVVPAAYLPLYAESPRYYYPVYPLLIAGSFGLAASLVERGGRLRALGAVGSLLLLASLAPPLRALDPSWTPVSLHKLPHLRAARRLNDAGLLGPIAGAEGRDGFFLAFLGGVPFYGSEPAPTPDRMIDSGASIFVTSARSALTAALARDVRFESLDSVAFPRAAPARQRPFRVFRQRSPKP